MAKRYRIVVTGASGFVAKNLRKYLSGNGVGLVSISRNSFRKFGNELRVTSKNYDEGDLLSKIKNSDALIHLAGIGKQSARTDYDTANVELTRHVVDLCKKAGIKKFVYTSGLGVSQNSPLGYFISKYRAEKIITSSGLDYTIFRPSYIVGKDDHFTKYLKRRVKRKKIEIPGSGNYSMQPVHIDDVARILLMSVTDSKFKNKTLDLVGPERTTFGRYVRLFSRGTKTDIRKISLENAYHDAIANRSDFGVDDLNILVGNFRGNHARLQRIAGIRFRSVLGLLKSGGQP